MYDIELTALICHTKRLPSEPLFSVGVQPISVNRVFRLMQRYDSDLTAFGISLRTALSEPLFSVGTRVQSFFVNRVYASAWIMYNNYNTCIMVNATFCVYIQLMRTYLIQS